MLKLQQYSPITQDILNNYMRLIYFKRCQFDTKWNFHFFDTLFYYKLDHLIQNNNYNFLDFNQYFDKQHYYCKKNIQENSIMVFLINNEFWDFVLIVADIENQKLILYDCQNGRTKDTFFTHAKKIKMFLEDYFNCFPIIK